MKEEKETLIVVGAGPVGLFVCSLLSNRFDVTLVDRGDERNEPSEEVLETFDGEEAISPVTTFGPSGGLAVWGGRFSFLKPVDFRNAPYDYDQFNFPYYYRQALKKLEIHEGSFEDEPVGRGIARETFLIANTDNAMDALLKECESRAKVRLKHRVVRIEGVANGNWEVVFEDGQRLLAAHLVIACGSLESARLLSASFSEHDIERRFGTHPKVTVGNALLSPKGLEGLRVQKRGKYRVEYGIVFDEVFKATGVRVYAQCVPGSVDYIFNEMERKTASSKIAKLVKRQMFVTKFLQRVFVYLSQSYIPRKRIYKLRLFFDQTHASAIRFDGAKLSLPPANEFDENLNNILKIVKRDFELAGLGTVTFFASDRIRKNIQYCHSHFTGAFQDVCDDFGHLDGHPGIYLCNAGLLPYSGYANPTASILALACRLADHLNSLARNRDGGSA